MGSFQWFHLKVGQRQEVPISTWNPECLLPYAPQTFIISVSRTGISILVCASSQNIGCQGGESFTGAHHMKCVYMYNNKHFRGHNHI